MHVAGATPTAELKQNSDFYLPLVGYTEVFVDKATELTIEDLFQKPGYFEPIETPYIDLGMVMGRAWLKVSVKNVSEAAGIWRFDINRQYYQELGVYVVRQGSSAERLLYQTHDNSYYDRPILDRMLSVDVSLELEENVDIYVSIRSRQTTFTPIGIGTKEAIVSLHAKEHAQNLFLNGALLTFVGFALILMSVVSWRLSISFSLYMIAGFGYVFHTDGYLFVHLWPNHMALNDPLNLTFMVLMSIFGLVFARVFFDIKKHFPRIDKFVLGYITLCCFIAVFSVPIYEVQATKVVAYLMTASAPIIQMFIAISALKKNLLGARPYLAGASMVMLSLIYALAAHLIPGYFDYDATLDFGHFTLIAEGLAFISAIAVRMLGIREERDRALRAELTATRDKLSLSTKLQKAQDDFIHARQMADMRRTQLSSVSHDLQQPLASLRVALGKMGGADEDAAQQMHSAFDYLEKLAFEQISAGKSDSVETDFKSNIERFPVSIVQDNVKEMFADEAISKGLKFRCRSSSAMVKSDPIALMRAVSNIVSNAIKHSSHGGVLLAARQRKDSIRIEVWDTGKGMSEDELGRCMEPYEKGMESQGSGLGLSIVKAISEELNLGFEIHSHQGRGSVVFLYLPIVS